MATESQNIAQAAAESLGRAHQKKGVDRLAKAIEEHPDEPGFDIDPVDREQLLTGARVFVERGDARLVDLALTLIVAKKMQEQAKYSHAQHMASLDRLEIAARNRVAASLKYCPEPEAMSTLPERFDGVPADTGGGAS